MAVVIETTLGDITVDLYLDQRPVTCLNFLKLCKMKYYNFNLFHTIRNGFIAQTGDPSGDGSGGKSIWGILEGPHKRFFSGEKMPKIRHTDAGLLSMVCTDDMMVGSQFFFTLAPDLNSLDGTHCVIGEVTEGHDVLTKLNEVICDESHRPYRDVRITHTVVLEDPFNDPSGLRAPSRSPSPSAERLKGGRIAPDEEIDEAQGKSAEEIQEMIEEKEAKARATILEIVGDLPDAEIAPPENVLFVCKLNPVTTDEDLEIIFSRFGKIVSCEVIRDKKTGNSLQYAFIEFDNKKSCEEAYFKMDNVLIDDRRIHVDFSQSVSKMRWLGKGRGVQYFDDDSKKLPQRDEVRGRYNDHRPEYSNNRRHHENDRNGEEKHRQGRERENYRDHKERERARDRDHRNSKREKNRDHKDRSRSRSKINYDKRHESRQHRNKSSKDSNKHRDHTEVRESSYRYDSSRNSHQNDHRSRSSPIRNDRNELQDSSSSTNRDTSKAKNGSRSHKENHDNNSQHSRHNESKYNKSEKDNRRDRSKQKSNKLLESKTPSPITKEKKTSSKTDKNSKQKHRDINLKNKEKKSRKRKHSTSSSLSSSESSTSSESSSSGSDRKKRKVSRKKRKHSTSSSSSETSSSSTTSSSDSSSDSSSSSNSSQEKRKRKNKKVVKKNKKKL